METTDTMLNQAADLLEKDDFISAEEILKKCIKNDDKNIEAYKNLGLAQVNLEKYEDAINSFQKAVELDKSDALSMYYLAGCYNKIGDKEEAIEQYKKVIELRPDYLDAYRNLAMLYIEFTNLEEAKTVAKSAIDNPNIENDYSIYYILATVYLMIKDHTNAIDCLNNALSINPNHLGMKNSLATCYMAKKDYDKAIDTLKEIIEDDKENSLANFNLGSCFEAKEDYKNALEYYKIAYSKDPSIAILSSLAHCSYRTGEFDLALNLYKNLISINPNNQDYIYIYAEILELKEMYSEALEQINTLLSFDSKNIAYTKKQGALLRKLELYDESVEIFNKLLKRGKIDVEVYYNLAFNYVALNDFDNAKEMFKKCIMLEPNNPYAHKDLGVLYLKMNCYEWAVEEMLEAINLEDDVAEFHYSLGVSYMMLSDRKNAKKSFENALKYEPDDADTLAYLGYIYLLENDREKCFELLEHALKVDKNNFLAKVHLAKYYFISKKYATAKQFLIDTVEKTKDDETLNMLAICYMETNEEENAMGILYKLQKKYPENHILLTNLAKCEFKCGKKKEALEHIRSALMIFDDYPDALKLLEEINQ